MTFEKLGLINPLLLAIKDSGYTKPSPIQAQAIPVILEGRDILGGAQTGTGKTAAFVLPLLQRLHATETTQRTRIIRALILTPTRELAVQVEASVKKYAAHLSLKSAVIFGGVKIEAQVHKLQRGFDILVATPGRLLDHIERRTVNLSKVEFLVLDEADRMLDMGFIRDIQKIITCMPKQRQNLLFSATYSAAIRTLADKILKSPVEIEIPKETATAERISQLMYAVEKSHKRELLSYLIGSKNWKQVLVFARTKHGADRLTKQLIQDGLSAIAIHGNKTQGARSRALSEFKDGKVRVLVATDVAARGLDIHQLPHVINYELPDVAEDYVHRIGRTGRAGNEGVALSLISKEETEQLKAIERLTKTKIPVMPAIPGLKFKPKVAQNEDKPSRRRPGPAGAKKTRAKKPQSRKTDKTDKTDKIHKTREAF